MSSSYLFSSRTELDNAIDAWVDDESTATEEYGDINTWDVSQVTDFSLLFANQSDFNSDISDWDVSNGTDFTHMFYGATSFNQYISAWNVGNVSRFYGTFFDARSFNQDISNWNVGNGKSLDICFITLGFQWRT